MTLGENRIGRVKSLLFRALPNNGRFGMNRWALVDANWNHWAGVSPSIQREESHRSNALASGTTYLWM